MYCMLECSSRVDSVCVCSFTAAGSYYAKMPDGGRSLFGADEDSKRVQLLWLRVFVAEGEGEKWELEGLTWKTSQ